MAPMIPRIVRNGRNQEVRIPAELIQPLAPSGWDRFFADPSLVLPLDFEPGDDPPPQGRTPL